MPLAFRVRLETWISWSHALNTFQEHRYSKDLSDLVSLLKSGMTGLALEDVEKLCLKYATRELFDKLKGEIG